MEEVGSHLLVDKQYAHTTELKKLLTDFLSTLLVRQPDDAYHFARQYFSTFHSNHSLTSERDKQHKAVVITGPSGVGKGTLCTRLLKEYPQKFGFSVSHTTRKPREGEIDGVHYHFTNLEEMQKGIADNLFLEHAKVHGNMYGTSKAAVDNVLKSGKVCILDIDVQGAEQVKKYALNQPCFIFIRPPSMEVLEKRLRGRGTETEESVKTRLENAKAELEYSNKEGFWDLVMTNDDLEDSYKKLTQWIFDHAFPAESKRE